VRKKKLVDERNKQLRLLITRAKEDAERWGTNEEPWLLKGIEEKTAHDFSIYDDAYKKFVKNRQSKMPEIIRNEGETTEQNKQERVFPFTVSGRSHTETELKRIADALERIADLLEREIEKE
jgi:hypothetical protein